VPADRTVRNRRPRGAGRGGALALAVAAWTFLSLALTVAPAGAIVTEVGSTKAGLQPRNQTFVLDGNGKVGASFNNPEGHPVVHSSHVSAIFWDPTDNYHGDWQEAIDTFLRGVGQDSGSRGNAFAVPTQYTDRSNQPASPGVTFQGAYTDTNGYPAAGCTDPHPLEPGDAITCLTDKQVQEELASFISQHGLAKGMGAIFYVLTPPGVTICLDEGGAAGHCSDYTGKSGEASYQRSFCSYHADMSPTNPTQGDGNTILYAMIPWSAGGLGNFHLFKEDQTPAFDCQNGFPAQQEPNQLKGTGPDGTYDHGLADLIINQISVEQVNTVTNPLLNAWQDSARNENTDECRNFFLPKLAGTETAQENTLAGTLSNEAIASGLYYLNMVFNLAADRVPYPGVPCVGGVSLAPGFTAPNPVNAGEIVAFDGMESNITLNGAFSFSNGGAEQANYATYVWNFGDGTPAVSGYAPGAPVCTSPWLSPCAASEFHAYTYGGTYNVTLAVTDVAGNRASVTHQVTVVGPAPPAPALGSSGSGTQAGTASGGPGGGCATRCAKG
jgi:hypothetical protein